MILTIGLVYKSLSTNVMPYIVEVGTAMGAVCNVGTIESRYPIPLVDKLAAELAEARGVNDELYQRDSIRWLIESEKIQEEIKARLEKEIQQ